MGIKTIDFLREAISKNLPAEVGEALKERLLEIDSIEAKNKSLKISETGYKTRIAELIEQVNLFSKNQFRKEELDLKAIELDKREIRIDLTMQQLVADNAVNTMEKIFELNRIMFKNNHVQKNVIERAIPSGVTEYNPTTDQNENLPPEKHETTTTSDSLVIHEPSFQK